MSVPPPTPFPSPGQPPNWGQQLINAVTDRLGLTNTEVDALRVLVDAGRLSPTALAAAFADKGAVDALQDLTSTGRLSEASLMSTFATQATAPVVANVQGYGAVADGATDDLPAFQAALTELRAAGGGTLWVPAPDVAYRLSAALDLGDDTENVTITGPSSYAAKIMCDGGFLTAQQGTRQITVTGLSLETHDPDADAIVAVYPRRWDINHCNFRGFRDGIRFEAGLHCVVDFNYFTLVGRAGVHFTTTDAGTVPTTFSTRRNYIGGGTSGSTGILAHRVAAADFTGDIAEGVDTGLRLANCDATVTEFYAEAVRGNDIETHNSWPTISQGWHRPPVSTWTSEVAPASRHIAINRKGNVELRSLRVAGSPVRAVQSLFLSAADLEGTFGSAVLGGERYQLAWSVPDSTSHQELTGLVDAGRYGATKVDVSVLWANPSTSSGQVRWIPFQRVLSPGETIDAATGVSTTVDADSQGVITETLLWADLDVPTSGLLTLTVRRWSRSGVTDPLLSAIDVYGIMLRWSE